MNQEPTLFPAWKQAVKLLLERGITFGQTITRDEIVQMCEIKRPADIGDVRRFDLELLQCTHNIKDALLTSHCMLLVSDNAGGYLVIHPRDQTRYAIEAGTKAIKREMSRMARGVSFVRADMLTAEQRRTNVDAQAKISHLAGMVLPANDELKKLANPE